MTLPSSYHRSNTHDDGPFRKVEAVRASLETAYGGGYPIVAYREDLECGHAGNYLGWRSDDGRPPWAGVPPRVQWTSKGKRRCFPCRPA